MQETSKTLPIHNAVYRSAASKLGHAAIEQKKARWRQRPKSHALEHGVYDFNSKNLKYLANWLDEDFIRRTKRLATRAFSVEHSCFVEMDGHVPRMI